jgi:uncharacterized protein YgiM (DUF1202 family)
LRKGRCSNDPKNCTLAGSKTEIPYAGIDSVCPECNSPLAAIAATTQAAPPPPPPPPPPIVQPVPPVYAAAPTPPPVYSREEAPRYETRQTAPFDQSYAADEPERKDSAMKLTQMVIVGAAIALLGFFAWRMFLQPRPVSAPELAATASVTGVADQQVTPISPAQLRRVNVATQAYGVPDAAGAVIAQLPAGSVLDVSGQIQVSGVNWLRVSLPNDSSKSGFVREDQLVNLGDGTLAVTPVDQLPGAVPQGATPPTAPAAPEVIGPIQAREPATFYIASLQANIRSDANATSTKVGAFEFTDPITVIGQRTVGARTWYQVQLPSGGTGWVNGRLVSTTPRDIPLDRETAQGTEKIVKLPPKPPAYDGAGDDKPALVAVTPGTTMRVDATVANLRKEPGATGNSIVEVLQRDTLMSVEDVRVLNGVPWYRVTSPNGAQGWVSGRTVVENR